MSNSHSIGLRCFCAAGLVGLVLACAPDADPSSSAADPEPLNLLVNPGFEQGREGWSDNPISPYWGEFHVVDAPVRSGRHAIHLPVRFGPGSKEASVHVHGVLQEMKPERFPDRVGGFYRVERWENDSPVTDLYLQFVAIVWGDPRSQELVTLRNPIRGFPNHQIRYYLAGVSEPPFRATNAAFAFVTRVPPRLDEWVEFEVSLRDDFREKWEAVPRDYEFLRLLFEARWDNKPPGAGLRADVYYDDLFVGYDAE